MDGEAPGQHRGAEHRALEGDRDVGEELRPRAVELGPLRGPAALDLHRAGVGQRRGDLSGGQVQEGPVVLVELEVRAGAEHEPPGRTLLTRQDQGKDDGGVDLGLAHRTRPGPRQARHEFGQAGHVLRRPGVDDLADVLGDDARRQFRVGPDPLPGDELRPGLAVEVDQAERAVGAGAGEHPEHRRHRLGGVPVHRSGEAAQALEHPETSRGQHARGGLHDGVEQPDDGAARLEDRAVGEGEVGLLVEPVPGHDQRQVLVVRRPTREDLGDHGLDVRPHVRPRLGRPLPQC